MSQQALHLRQNFDQQKNRATMRSLNSQRHQGYLKDMLVQKFLQKNRIDLFPKASKASNDQWPQLQQ